MVGPPRPDPNLSARAAAWAPIGLIALGVWLGWAIIANGLGGRLPPELAVQLAPGSPSALTRLADQQEKAGRTAAAARTARAALARTPFNAVALRVLGLSLARTRPDRADQLMTLAGNWTLRDSPTHLWLFEHRISQGETTSALAHVDTVLRRRLDLREPLFAILLRGSQADPAFRGALLQRLALGPNWRTPYLAWLVADPKRHAEAATLILALTSGQLASHDPEVELILTALLRAREFEGLRATASQLGLLQGKALKAGDFEHDAGQLPFAWDILGTAGAGGDIVDDAEWGGKVLVVDYDGLSAAPVARHLLALSPGRYILTARKRTTGRPDAVAWRLACAEGAALASELGHFQPNRVLIAFDVPKQNCSLQWLELRGEPGERFSAGTVIFDDIDLKPVN